jgi:hypothetical protein
MATQTKYRQPKAQAAVSSQLPTDLVVEMFKYVPSPVICSFAEAI